MGFVALRRKDRVEGIGLGITLGTKSHVYASGLHVKGLRCGIESSSIGRSLLGRV